MYKQNSIINNNKTYIFLNEHAKVPDKNTFLKLKTILLFILACI